MILRKDFTFYFSEYFLLKFYFTHFLFIHLKKIKYNIDFNEKSSLVSVESVDSNLLFPDPHSKNWLQFRLNLLNSKVLFQTMPFLKTHPVCLPLGTGRCQDYPVCGLKS